MQSVKEIEIDIEIKNVINILKFSEMSAENISKSLNTLAEGWKGCLEKNMDPEYVKNSRNVLADNIQVQIKNLSELVEKLRG